MTQKNHVLSVHVETLGEPTLENSQWLQILSAYLEKELQLPCVHETVTAPPDSQAVDPVVAIALANLAVSLFSVFINIVQFLSEQHQRGSITIETDGYTLTFEKLTDAEIRQYVQKLEQNKIKNVKVKIGK